MIRAFWVLHRAIFRVTGGRIGLWRPRAGKRFGVMGLRTTGRRSGRDRTVIVGYFEDGTNLVTLAMNGWAGTEPAWWLNLKSRPDATVVLRPGPRAVQARTAEGDERERLWAKFGDYPGWGEDIDALAERRSFKTAVVIFETRITNGPEDGTPNQLRGRITPPATEANPPPTHS